MIFSEISLMRFKMEVKILREAIIYCVKALKKYNGTRMKRMKRIKTDILRYSCQQAFALLY